MRAMVRMATVAALLCAVAVPAQVQVSVDKGVRYQTIEGFGATISGAYGLRPWTVKQGAFWVEVNLDSVGLYDSIIDGLGLTAVRTAVDDAYNPSPGQYVFSAGMRGNLLDLRKLRDAARRHNEPAPKVIGSLWSPPAAMKVSGTVACTGVTSANCSLKPGYQDSLGVFLSRYARVMSDSGMPFYAVSLQNEPAFLEPYASCVYNGGTYLAAARSVGAAFEAAGMHQILFGAEGMSGSFGQFEGPIRANTDVLAYYKAWAVHGYTDGVHSDTGSLSGATPTDKPLWMTETSGDGYGTSMSDWNGALSGGRAILNYLRNGRLTLWTWWTLQNPDTTAYAYYLHLRGVASPKWWVSKHFFRYIRPGARQIASTCGDADVLVVAFWHEQNQCLSIVLINTATSAKTLNAVSVTGGSTPTQFEKLTSSASAQNVVSTVSAGAQVSLPASSITTLVAGAYRGTGTAVQLVPSPAAGLRARVSASRLRTVYSLDGRSMRTGGQGVVIAIDERGARAVLSVVGR